MIEPEVIEPEVIEPEVIVPEVIVPEVVEPAAAEPEVVEPEVVEPEESEEANRDKDMIQEMLDDPDNGSLERDTGMKLNNQIEGGVPEGYAGHHLIGIAEANQSDAMKAAAECGYNVNNENNGIALPTTEAESERTGLPLHDGRHLGEYTDMVAEQLQNLDDEYLTSIQEGECWSPDYLISQVHEVESSIRSDLLEHNVRLQTADPN